jgi:hypothetical protein
MKLHRGVVILVLGILGLVVCGRTCWSQNPQSLKRISAKGFAGSTSAAYVSLVAEVLPLPGQYAGDSWSNDNSFKGILLKAGTDNTKGIQPAGTNPVDIQSSDIFVLGEPNRFHVSWSDKMRSLPITLLPLPSGKGDRKVVDLLGPLHKGRVVRLVGEFNVPIVAMQESKGAETLKFVCGPSAMCWFDSTTGKIMWQDIRLGTKSVASGSGTPPAAAAVKSLITKPGAVILDQNFMNPKANGTWHTVSGRWSMKDGMLTGSKGHDGKSACMTYPLPCRAAVLTLRFQLTDKNTPLIVRFENEKGQFCGVLIYANSLTLQKCELQSSGGSKLKFVVVDLTKKTHQLDIGERYNLTVKLCGEEFSAAVEKGASAGVKNPNTSTDITKVDVIFSGGTGRLTSMKAVVPEN